MHYPDHLLKLIYTLKKLPGVGQKTAERFAFQLLNWPTPQLNELAATISQIPNKLIPCEECGCIKGTQGCYFCEQTVRNNQILCVLANAKDVFSIEETGEYKGLYHVLGGLLSPLDQTGPDELSIEKLKSRVVTRDVKEVIIALDSTLEGDATSLFLKQELAPLGVQISRLAFGLPMGSALDYVDGGTLAKAFSGRNQF